MSESQRVLHIVLGKPIMGITDPLTARREFDTGCYSGPLRVRPRPDWQSVYTAGSLDEVIIQVTQDGLENELIWALREAVRILKPRGPIVIQAFGNFGINLIHVRLILASAGFPKDLRDQVSDWDRASQIRMLHGLPAGGDTWRVDDAGGVQLNDPTPWRGARWQDQAWKYGILPLIGAVGRGIEAADSIRRRLRGGK